MDHIFHEKQEGSLCAQHALNVLLQDQYYTADVLAQIGRDLDVVDHHRYAEIYGADSEEYLQRTEQSQHYDDSGYFSLDVISQALSAFNLRLVSWQSDDAAAEQARKAPALQNAYICNYRSHWLTIRRFGAHWFNLNSMLPRPEPISDTYLSLYLTQLITEKFHIFVVVGELPVSEADRYFAEHPFDPKSVQQGKNAVGTSNSAKDAISISDDEADDDVELQLALSESRRLAEEGDDALRTVLQSSRVEYGDGAASSSAAAADDDELQRAIQLSMSGASKSAASTSAGASRSTDKRVNSSNASAAKPGASLKASHEALPQTSEEIRQKRLKYFSEQGDKTDKDSNK